mmetsp:Transcript_3176/g.4287  ORF Transcript_3176/g.4287 Transcript_3176/m.4287 type:complete len:196 (-) Transcript_3176:149-736(-)
MAEENKQAATATAQQPGAKEPIPISEPSTIHRRIPRAVFFEDVEAWVDKYGEDDLFAQLNELHQKYKFMENQLIRQKASLKAKNPEIKRTLEMVVLLKQKHDGDDKTVDTNFLVSDNIWAKAKVPNTTGKVGLWLGANVMVEYTFADALQLLGKNLSNAQQKLTDTEDDLDYLKEQTTTTEVNIARVYNQGVANK